MTEPASSVFSASWPGLALLHADAECVVVSKPSGIHSVPGLGSDKHDSLLTRLQAVDPLFHAVHRLDRDTSGVMVFGRTKAAVRALGMQFEARTVHKRYVALVAGQVADDAGEINLPMRYAPEIKPRQIVDAVNGKPATTLWQVLERRADTTLLALTPITGRTHQLRVHCQAMGHAIVGDSLYASEIWQRARTRLCLHASELSFDHPSSGERMRFVLPESFTS